MLKTDVSKLPHAKIQCPAGNFMASKQSDVAALSCALLEKDSRGFENVIDRDRGVFQIYHYIPITDQKASTIARALWKSDFFILTFTRRYTLIKGDTLRVMLLRNFVRCMVIRRAGSHRIILVGTDILRGLIKHCMIFF